MKIYDLSVSLKSGMDIFPGDPAYHIEAAARIEEEGCNVSNVSFGTHTGTHIDVPRHFIRDGVAVDTYPPDRFFGTAYFADAVGQARENGRIDLNRLDLSAVRKGDFLVVSTGWEYRRGTEAFFTGLPTFTRGTAEHLAQLGVRLLGTDMPTVLSELPDGFLPPPAGDVPAEASIMHADLLSRDILILEGLVGLKALHGRRMCLSCLPLLMENADGSPVRAVAFDSHSDLPGASD